jgi:hypothetical protein
MLLDAHRHGTAANRAKDYCDIELWSSKGDDALD